MSHAALPQTPTAPGAVPVTRPGAAVAASAKTARGGATAAPEPAPFLAVLAALGGTSPIATPPVTSATPVKLAIPVTPAMPGNVLGAPVSPPGGPAAPTQALPPQPAPSASSAVCVRGDRAATRSRGRPDLTAAIASKMPAGPLPCLAPPVTAAPVIAAPPAAALQVAQEPPVAPILAAATPRAPAPADPQAPAVVPSQAAPAAVVNIPATPVSASPPAPSSSATAVPPNGITPLPALAASTPVIATHRAAPAATTGAVGQVAHAVLTLAAPASGTRQMTLRLDPASLGQVEIRIEHRAGAATVTVSASRGETLQALQADLPRLHQALDRAGVPQVAREVSLVLAPPPPPGGGFAAMGQGGGGGQQHGAPPRHLSGPADPADDSLAIDPPIWLRAGIDITA